MTMRHTGTKAGKFDIVTSIAYKGQYVVEGFYPELHAERGGMYQMVCLKDGSTALKFASEFTVVTRHPNNSELDREYSDLAKAKNHAFNQMRLELV